VVFKRIMISLEFILYSLEGTLKSENTLIRLLDLIIW
jgi:hypothetical protein